MKKHEITKMMHVEYGVDLDVCCEDMAELLAGAVDCAGRRPLILLGTYCSGQFLPKFEYDTCPFCDEDIPPPPTYH